MLTLRPYKPCDAAVILSWIRDEETFRKWSTDRYERYPIAPEDMNRKYLTSNGDCPEPDNFYPFTLCDETGPVGHLILRYTAPGVVRFGFIIVDESKRGRGYGRAMLRLALGYAAGYLGAKKVTLGVLENNPQAHRCYQAAGFRDVPTEEPVFYRLLGKQVQCLEMEYTLT